MKFQNSPLRYPGGKSRAVNQIVKIVPKIRESIGSPFLGGGWVELALAQRGHLIFGSDNFVPLMDFWHCLRNEWNRRSMAEFARKHIGLSKDTFKELQNRLRELIKEEREYMFTGNILESAAIFFVLNRASFSGCALSGGMSKGDRLTANSIQFMREFSLNGKFVLNCWDFEFAIGQYHKMFLFCDPPYCNDSVIYADRQKNGEFDHEGLAKLLNNRGGWLLCYNDCEMIRDLYSGAKFIDVEWKYGMTKNKASNEIIIMRH